MRDESPRGTLAGLKRSFRLVPVVALQALALIGCGDDGSSSSDNATSGGGGTPSTSVGSTSSGGGGAPSSSTSGTGDPSTTTTSTGGEQPGGSPVAQHGRLQVMGNHVVDEHGAELQLKGMSLFWSVWEGEKFYNAAAVSSLADDWKATVVRAAMAVSPGDGSGYLQNADAEKAKVKTVVDAAIAKGIYVIIDWHDHEATQHTQPAKDFFREMAQQYGNQPNVIFEVFNEPLNTASWNDVKAYAEQVIGEIRNAGSQNLVIVGSPNWSQDADVAAQNPITAYQNIAYTLHFYANTHRQGLRDKATAAMSRGVALFVTEWGTCDASGNGGLDFGESQAWIDFMDSNKLSWLNWSIVDKNESCAALTAGSSANGPWADGQLTESGRWIKQKIQEP